MCLECINNDVPLLSELSRSYLFHGACFHAGLIDPRWAASELSTTPAEPTEIGFLLALKHRSVKGTTAQATHTLPAPDGYVVRPRVLYALNMCASLCPPSLTHRNVLCVTLLFWCSLTFEVWQGFSDLCLLSCSLLSRLTQPKAIWGHSLDSGGLKSH